MIVDSARNAADLLFHATDVGLALIRPDGTILEANEAFLSLCGLTAGDAATISDLLPDGMVTGRKSAATLPSEWRHSFGGSSVLLRAKSLPDGSVAVTATPGEANSVMESRIEALEESLSLAMRASKLGVWTRDFSTGKVDWSPELEALFGLQPDTFASDEAAFFNLVHPDDREKVAQAVEESVRTGNDYQVEFRFRRSDGSEGWMEGRGRTIVGSDGRPRFMAGSGIDITEKKQVEQALIEGQNRYRNLVELLPAGVCTCGPDGVINFFNRRATEIWGRTPPIPDPSEKYCGSFELYTLDGVLIEPESNPVAVCLRTGQSFRGVEARVVRPDGSSVIAEVNIEPFRDEAGQIVGAINVFLDVSTRHGAAKELGTLNDAARLLGSTLDLPTIYDRLQELVASVMDCDNMVVSSYDRETNLVSCTYAWLEGQRGDPTIFPPVPLAPEGKGMQSTVIRTGEPLVIKDAEEGRKRCTTSVIVEKDGRVSDQPSDESPPTRSIVMVPITLEGKVTGVVQVMSFNLNAYGEEHVRLLQGMVQQMAVAVQNAGLYEAAQLEIARRQKLEAELEERVVDRTKELQAANREMEGFTYSVSHDLRAPLRAIISAAMILLEDHRNQVEPLARVELERMATAASKMGRLIDDLLQYSRLWRTDLERRRLDLTSLAREITDTVAVRHRKDVQVEIEPELAAQADPLLLKLALENLIDNAFKYSSSGDPRIWIGRYEDDGQVIFYVKDNGIGFDQQYSNKIFKPFERLVLDSQYPGTGIGLANVKRIFERHGGKVWAEGKLGKGSTFYFTLA